MASRFRSVSVLALGATVLIVVSTANASAYRAFSLGEAEKALKTGQADLRGTRTMGGITRPVGCMLDEANSDVVIFGVADSNLPELRVDELAVAMRAVLKHGQPPRVSIDPAPRGAKPEDQVVRFYGKLENTRFGKDLLHADVVLKKLGLGKLNAEVWGVRSYFDLSAEEWHRSGNEDAVMSRFWFLTDPDGSALAARSGVGLVKRLKIKVQTEVATSSAMATNALPPVDTIGNTFADSLTAALGDVMLAMPELRRLDQLYRLVGVASLMERWRDKFGLAPDTIGLDYWLNDASVEKVATPVTFDLVASTAPGTSGKGNMTISGGIDLRMLVADVKGGSLSALKELVVKSRPSRDSLVWAVPIGNALDEITDMGVTEPSSPRSASVPAGTHLLKIFAGVGAHAQVASAEFTKAATSRASVSGRLSKSQVDDMFKSGELHIGGVPQSQRVGGVMLSGVAKAGDGAAARVGLEDGSFSLVVGGENARLDPRMFRKFVTALWAVYFGRTHPGLSIDPIYQDPKTGDFSPKHMVRYIGRVVNTDLGRVMRDTDYIMKKWFIGTERPDIPGFKNPDDYSGSARTVYSTLSRFWLTPENMKFRTSDNMLMFDGGHMTVKTEILGYEDGDRPKNPHNEAFARFFTEHYDEIAAKYPIYQDLSDYGRLVALAKYLKDSGIPLFWFLMANKDLVMTEDSPGTVDNLAKKSAYWEGMRVQGGVDMAMPKGQFVYDASALKAIEEARQQAARNTTPNASQAAAKPMPSTEPFSFGLGTNSYTVTPQHSLTCGKDRRGIRYQTDLCLRAEGYTVGDEVVEVLQSELLRHEMRRLLEPILEKLPKDDDAKAEAAFSDCHRRASKTVEPLQNRVAGLKGKTFATEETCAEAWKATVGENAPAGLRALFVTSCHYVSNLEIVRFFNPALQSESEFGKGWRLMVPYRIRPSGKETAEFNGLVLPSRMELVNELTGGSETFFFSATHYSVAGYVPVASNETQWVGLFLLTDATFRLADKVGGEYQFDVAGRLSDMILSEDHAMHFDYLASEPVTFAKMPYLLEEVGEDKIVFKGFAVPKKIMVTLLSSKLAETFSFNPDGDVVGYAPDKGKESAYRFVGLMSDASYRLVDGHGNEIDFTEGGIFEQFKYGGTPGMVRSISSGGHKVAFDYTLGHGGRLLVCGSRLMAGAGPEQATCEVRYEYDNDDRLCAVKRTTQGQEEKVKQKVASNAR